MSYMIRNPTGYNFVLLFFHVGKNLGDFQLNSFCTADKGKAFEKILSSTIFKKLCLEPPGKNKTSPK